jgi:WD40 repeat protein
VICIWNLSNGQILNRLEGHTAPISAIALRADGQTLFSSSKDNTIRMWNLENGAHLRTLKGHFSYVNSALALDRTGKTLISGGTGIPLKIWSVTNSLG